MGHRVKFEVQPALSSAGPAQIATKFGMSLICQTSYNRHP